MSIAQEGNNRKILVDVDEVRRALSLLFEDRQVVELRALDVTTKQSWRPYTASGYFDDYTKLIESLGTFKSFTGVYVTLQECEPQVIYRAYNHLSEQHSRDQNTKDVDVLRYRWLPIDTDPKRPAGIPSSDEQHQEALDLAQRIRDFLTGLGWPEPLACDSANGGHSLYRINLEVTPEHTALLQSVLEELARRFDTTTITVDKKNFNPSRIFKLYGTAGAKGDDVPEHGRPHRLSRVLAVPDPLMIVTKEQMEALVTLDDQPQGDYGQGYSADSNISSFQEKKNSKQTKQKQAKQKKLTWDTDRMEAWLTAHEISFEPAKPVDDGMKWKLAECPFCHNGLDAVYVFSLPHTLGFECSHNSCADKHWHDFREHFEPGYDQHQNQDQEQAVSLSQAQRLVQMAEENSERLFMTSKGEMYIRLKVQGHIETLPISERGGGFKRWLVQMYREAYHTIPGSDSLSQAMLALEAQAQWGGAPRQETFVRMAEYGGNRPRATVAVTRCRVDGNI